MINKVVIQFQIKTGEYSNSKDGCNEFKKYCINKAG